MNAFGSCRLELKSVGLKSARRMNFRSKYHRSSTFTNSIAMSGLVGYDSSSDEEAPIKPRPNVAPPSEALNPAIAPTSEAQPNKDEVIHTPIAPRDEPTIGPLLGPAAKPNGTSAIDETGSPTPLADISERDAIRYLTQAPVPATSLPPSPPGSPDPAANERFRRFLELKTKGLHFNEDLAKKTTFRNPSLLSTMMSRAGIAEQSQFNTSLPLDLWNPTDFPEWAYKEGLLKSQQEIQGQNEAKKKMLSASGKRTIDFALESTSAASSRKSTPGQQSKRRRA